MLQHWPGWRLQLARSLAWALLLAGWMGLGSLSLLLTPSHRAAFALVAVWLLALGASAELLRRWPLPRWGLRAALLTAAAAAALAMTASLQGRGQGVLALAWLAWATVVALASVTVRRCRQGVAQRAGPPVAAAAVGAALVCWGVGDLADLPGLVPRLVLGVLGGAVMLAALCPPGPTPAGGCRAGLFDCSLPTWSVAHWRQPRSWPVALASLVMLPTMCSLPLTLALCSSDRVPGQAVLGLHLAAMFLPALWAVGRPVTWLRHAPLACAMLLALGAALILRWPGPVGWWSITLTHGVAWSLAWATQLHRHDVPAAHHHPLRSAAFNAALVLALGVSLDATGLFAISAWHVALGLAAALAWLWCRLPGPAPTV
jgi:hypothetical protein